MTSLANSLFIRKEADALWIVSNGDTVQLRYLVLKHAQALREFAEHLLGGYMWMLVT